MYKQNKYTIFLIVIVAFLIYSSTYLISNFTPFIPDWDGLAYFDYVKQNNAFLFDIQYLSEQKKYGSIFPITNSLSVFLAVFIYGLFESNYIPLIINGFYLLIFTLYIKYIKNSLYACFAVILICSQTLFFRLFTTFTSEFAVGLWIFAFLLTLVSECRSKRMSLVFLTIIGSFLRNIDVVFVFSALFIYLLICRFFFKERKNFREVFLPIVIGQIIALLIFNTNYLIVYDYMKDVSTHEQVEVWKALAQVKGQFDVFIQYGRLVFLYNPYVLVLISITIVLFLFLFRKINNKKYLALVLSMPLSICLPLFSAKTLNIQVVFWVYVCLIFTICEFGMQIIKFIHQRFSNISLSKKIIIQVVLIFCMICYMIHSVYNSWKYEVKYLSEIKHISEISFKITQNINSGFGGVMVSANFMGIGPLDILGLNFYNKPENKYSDLALQDHFQHIDDFKKYLMPRLKSNYIILADENYFFPKIFPINQCIKETYHFFTNNLCNYGFKKINHISVKGKNFDIWYRPNTIIHLQYANHGDSWISSKVPLEIGRNDILEGASISGRLAICLSFPMVEFENYAPPFEVSITKAGSNEVVSSATVTKYGENELIFNLANIKPGYYELNIDKKFKSKSDPRELSAQFIQIADELKYDPSF